MTNRLGKLPAFLRVPNGNNSDEPIENISVNTINLVAALIDKIQASGSYQNDWSNIDIYLPEFKLEEVMEGLVGKFDITDPKMLKGFVRSKGTSSDLDYVSKFLGIDIDIHDADYYSTLGIVNMMLRLYPQLFSEIEDWGITDDMIISWLGIRVRVVNNRNPEIVNNITPQVVVNYQISSYDVLVLMGYENPSSGQVLAFDDVLDKYYASLRTDPYEYDCAIVVSISYDMDIPTYNPDILNDLSSLVDTIVDNRLLPHIRVQGYTLSLVLQDVYGVESRITEGDLTYKTVRDGTNDGAYGSLYVGGSNIIDRTYGDGNTYNGFVGGNEFKLVSGSVVL